MAFSKGKGRNEQGTFQQSTFIHITRMYSQGSETIMQHTGKKALTGREQRHKQGKALRPNIVIISQALNRFYLSGHGATRFTQKKGKGHSHRREWQTGSVDLYST